MYVNVLNECYVYMYMYVMFTPSIYMYVVAFCFFRKPSIQKMATVLITPSLYRLEFLLMHHMESSEGWSHDLHMTIAHVFT